MMMVVTLANRALAHGVMFAGPVVIDAPTDNIAMVMYKQVVSNPASILHGLIMCIIAFLIDETTWVNSRYIPHITIIFGGCTYWLYAGSATVAQCYPYPWVVLASNGMISGLFAFGAHKQVVARFVKLSRQRNGNTEFLTKPNQQNP